jgi:hypothetical protein
MSFPNVIEKLETLVSQYTESLKEAVEDVNSAKNTYNERQKHVEYLTALINEMVKTVEILKKRS